MILNVLTVRCTILYFVKQGLIFLNRKTKEGRMNEQYQRIYEKTLEVIEKWNLISTHTTGRSQRFKYYEFQSKNNQPVVINVDSEGNSFSVYFREQIILIWDKISISKELDEAVKRKEKSEKERQTLEKKEVFESFLNL